MGCTSDAFLVKLVHLETQGDQGQVQEAVSSWSSFGSIVGSDLKKIIIVTNKKTPLT
jgi:hypothetical protein